MCLCSWDTIPRRVSEIMAPEKRHLEEMAPLQFDKKWHPIYFFCIVGYSCNIATYMYINI